MQGNNYERGLSRTTHKRFHLSSGSSESVLHLFWPLTLSGEEASTVNVFKSLVQLPPSARARSKVTEDADVSKLFAVAVRGQGEQKGPLEAHEAPNTRQVEAPRVR